MKIALVLGTLLLVLTATVPALSQAPWVLYDNFNAPLINPNRWFGAEGNGPITRLTPQVSAESERLVQGGRLRMSFRSYGLTTSDVDPTNNALRLMFTSPATIIGVRATVGIRRYDLTPCPTNATTTTRVQARLIGVFFNAGTSTLGDFSNDVFALVRLFRRVDSADPPGVFQVQGFVFRCDDFDCRISTNLPIATLGTISTGTTGTVSVQWDRGNHQFLFRYGTTQASIPYPWSDTTPSANVDKRLDVSTGVPNCTAAARPMAFIEAGFNDVYVNR